MPLSLAEATAQLTAPGQAFEVGEELVAGVPTRVWKNCMPSLRSIFELSAGFGEATFLVYEDERLSFAAHFEAAAELAGTMSERLGIKKGDRVAIAMRNCPEWVISFWAAAALGAVIVPLNAWWTGAELAYGLSDSGTGLAFVDGERLARLEPHLEELRGVDLRDVVVARIDEAKEPAGPPKGVEHFEELIPRASRTAWAAGSAASATDAAATSASAPPSSVRAADPVPGRPALPEAEIAPDDDATIFYTSGTTGRPKGALGTQRNICTNLTSLGFLAARSQLMATEERRSLMSSGGAQNSHLVSVPLFHATGCHSVLVAATASGGKLVMMRRFNPERALELIERERVTIFGGVPTIAWQVLNSPDFELRDTSSVRSVSYGGAPAPPELLRRIKDRFPVGNASNGYGLTETSSVTSMNSGEDYVHKPESVGPPVPVCEVRVVDVDGSDVPTGKTGELWIKGPNVVKGYWHKPEATAQSFSAGWLHSGDVARLDDEGFIYIVDRAKDMVIRGGENVYSVEVEAAIFEHPSIADTAVIGIPDIVLGEEVAAVVVLRPGHSLSSEALADHVAERIARFKVPTRIFFRKEPLPRNPAGKVLKRQLRDEVLG